MGLMQASIPSFLKKSPPADSGRLPATPRRHPTTTADDDQTGAPTENQADLDIGDLLNTAISTVDFEPEDLQRSLSAKQRATPRPVDWRFVALAAILVILIFMFDLLFQWI
jgi:hypothetical protein